MESMRQLPGIKIGILYIALWIQLSQACFLNYMTDGNYSISPLQDINWLNSGPIAFHLLGKWRTLGDGTLTLNQSWATSGKDEIGQYQDVGYTLQADPEKIQFKAAIRTYPTLGIPVAIFIQSFPQGLNGSKTDLDTTISSFPSFKMEGGNDSYPLGYLSFGSYMFGDMARKTGIWHSKAVINDGLEGTGPLAVFDKQGNAVLFSPYNNFMAASMWQDKEAAILKWGIMGGVNALPVGFEYKTIAYCSNSGLGQAFSGWGKLMRQVYKKTDEAISLHEKSDLSLTHLGYWTDNGAYYYYKTEEGKNYEDTLLDVKNHAIGNRIPYRYIQLDSWFYPKDSMGAVTTWDAHEDIFPKGIPAFQDRLQMPLVAHNRYWSVNTTYAKSRGGYFDFNVEGQYAIPTEQIFWEYLLGHGKEEWGLIVYEQDWLNVQFLHTNILTSDLNMARTWLTQMGTAAGHHGLKIQYCMALPRQALQSLEIPVVTQARVSNDYHARDDQWRIGVTSHFAHAMGIAPSKDTFWTMSEQPGNKYNKTEQHPTLQIVTAVFSTGPVGPGDKIETTNKDLLMQCCDDDGLILKPSRPALAIDDQLLEEAFQDGIGAKGEVWTTYTTINNLLFGIIMAAGLSRDYVITPAKAGFLAPDAPEFVDSILYYKDKEDKLHFQPFPKEGGNFTILMSECNTYDNYFCIFYTAPIWTFGNQSVTLLGDLNKWVPVSERRILQVLPSSSGLDVIARGRPVEETISLTFLQTYNNDTTGDHWSPNTQMWKTNGLGCATFSLRVDSSMSMMDTTPFTTLLPITDCRFEPPTAYTTPIPISHTTQGAMKVKLGQSLLLLSLFIAFAFTCVQQNIFL